MAPVTTPPPAAPQPTSVRRLTRSICANKWNRSSRRWSDRAIRACRSPPSSISIASPRPRTNSIRTAASSVRARPERKPPRVEPEQQHRGYGRQRTARRQSAPARQPVNASPSDQSRKSEEIVNYGIVQDDEDGSDRRRQAQSPFGRGPGRRHLCQGQQGQCDLSTAQQGRPRPDRRAGALGDRLRRRNAATKSRSSTCALPKPRPIRSSSRPAGCPCCISPKTTS